MNVLLWYFKRLKSLSVRELGYRAKQVVQGRIEKRFTKISFEPVSYNTVPLTILHIENYDELYFNFDIHLFGLEILPSQIKDWSYDFFSKKTFPPIYSKDINMRTDKYGSAKHVWEYNRMLFLPQLALAYKKTGNRKYFDEIIALLDSWIEQNPYLIGINWYSNIEINIRLINWFLTWEILDVDSLVKVDPVVKKFVEDKWIPTIYQHCKYSFDHPSLYSSANNHLISEYSGLFIATSKWRFKESENWNVCAKAGLEREIVKQHSRNGVNKEEAAEYIQFITDFFLLPMLVADNTGDPFSQTYKTTFRNILHYIYNFLDVKGNFPKYGDEDDGRVFVVDEFHKNNFISLLTFGATYFKTPELVFAGAGFDQKNLLFFGEQGRRIFAELTEQASSLRSSSGYPNEGHFILRKQVSESKEIYCHFDAAPLGFLSIAAHGHADALSFIIHIDGQPVFIDSGTFCYHTHPQWRKYFLSTLAHNTVTVNNDDQAKFIGPTLWLNHYTVKTKEHSFSDTVDSVTAEHDGYKKYGITHTRKIEFF